MLLRPGRAEDAERLLEIRGDPAIARIWGNADLGEIHDDFIDVDHVFVVEVDGEVIGAIQFGEEDDPMYRSAGIDIFLAPSHQGRGFGTEAIRLLAQYLFEERGHHRLIIDPATDNEAAIRAYEAVGFRPVGIMRRYERGPDGTWHDGLLMDMLKEDFKP